MSYTVIIDVFMLLWLAALSYTYLRHVRRVMPGHDPRVVGLLKQFGEWQIEVADLRDLYERLMTSHKRLRSSAGMAKLRGIKEAAEQDDLKTASEAEILRRMNLSRRP